MPSCSSSTRMKGRGRSSRSDSWRWPRRPPAVGGWARDRDVSAQHSAAVFVNSWACVFVYLSMSTDVVVIPSTAATTPDTPPPLPSDVPTLQAMIVELLDALHEAQHEREGLQHRLDQLLRRLYGPKAERFDPNQPWLIPEMAAAASETMAATTASDNPGTPEVAKPKRPGHGRQK